MTQAMHDVIDQKYEYKGQEDVDTVFNQTIGKNGLNPASAKEFVDRLRILAEDDKKLPGTNKIFFDKLQDQLLVLPSRTVEQIKLENQKSEILTKADKEKDAAKKEALYEQAVEIQNKIDGVTAPVSTDAKADIERKSGESVKDFMERLFSNNYFTEVSGKQIFSLTQGRWGVIVNIDGVQVPFYQSTSGTDTKVKGQWYPFFGDQGNWVIKGNSDDSNIGYGFKAIQDVQSFLNNNIKETDAIALSGIISKEVLQNQSSLRMLDESKIKGNEKISLNKEATAERLASVAGYSLEEGRKTKSDSELFQLASKKIFAELASLGTAETVAKDNFDIATKKNGIKDITDVFFAEQSYQDGRDAGDFFDLAKDYLESGKKPEFNENIITREAYDNLIGVLDPIKSKIESGELYIVGRDLVVYDSDIDLGNDRRDRIAGEIDLILVDKDGIYVLDIKSGEASKFLNFNNLSSKQKIFSKRNEYTLQTAGYATMLERMIDRRVAGLAMLPIQRASNKETNQVIEVKKPINPDLYEEINYKRDADGNIILSKEIDPKTGKPFNEKQFEKTKKKYKYDFLVPLYRESVQEEIDKLFGKKEGKLAPGAKRTLSRRYSLFRSALEQITDEESKANIDKIRRAEKLINDAVEKDGIIIPDDIANLLAQKKQALRAYTGKEVIKSIIKKYKEDLSDTEKKVKDQKEALEKITSNISFDDIDKSKLEDGTDFIEEQLAKDKDFAFYYKKHDDFKEEDSKDAAEVQKLTILTMKASRLLTDQDIEDDLIDELTMADASELIHEGVKRIQYLKTETTDNKTLKELKDYQSKISLLTRTIGLNTNNLNILETLEAAEFNAEQGLMDLAYEQISKKIQNLEDELNRNYTKPSRRTDINKELVNFNKFKEALALAYEIPIDIFENIVEEEEEVIEDEYDNVIKVGDTVYSRTGTDTTPYTVKEITPKNYILKDPKGKEISVEISKFDEQYITESEMNAGETTPPGYNPTEGEKSVMQESQMSVDDFLRKAEEDKAKAYQEGVSNTLAQNRENLLNKTKDCP